jgi:hypothetical protein
MNLLSEQLLALAPALGATIIEGSAPVKLRMTHGAHVVHLTATDGKHPSLTIEVESPVRDTRSDELLPFDVPEPPLVELVREGPIHRLGKALRLNREVQSGDPTFDAAVYIHANQTPNDYIRHILQHADAREAIRALLQADYHQITLDAHAHGGLVRVSRSYLPLDEPPAEALRRDLTRLATIADTLPTCAPRAQTRRMERGAATTFGVGVWTFASIFFAAICDYMWPIHGPDWIVPWLISAMSWAAAFPILLLWLRGSSRALHALLSSQALLLIALPCTLLPGLRAVNALLDFSKPRIVPASILSLTATSGSKSTTYKVSLDLGDGVPPEHRSISWNDYRKLSMCRPSCAVVLGEGALGWPWIDDFVVAP